MILGVDVGGTFTDFVLLDDAGEVSIHKLLTSARDPSWAILAGIDDLQVTADATVVHGATVATNALLERRGARTALITTEGFRDVLEIGRQTRPDLYALHPTRPAPLVPAARRFEVRERIAPPRQPESHHRAGRESTVLIPLDPDQTDEVVSQVLATRARSVAVCFLFSFLDPSHERQVRDRIAALGGDSAPHVSLSCEILPEYREYERMATTVVNAYVAPLMNRYLANLEQGLAGRPLRIMQSNGGIISAGTARAQAARTALSGPAGGVVGAFELARTAGFDQVITFDMGGTSTDVALCPGRVQESTEGTVAGIPLRLPIIDIHTVGAGGGSIARLDQGGALRVGPESAGSDPGPVCYGRDDAQEITVTDANLILGRLDADHFLGGRMKLDLLRPQSRLQDLAHRLSLPMETTAWGVIRVANSNMERAIRTISVERGHDPRQFTLLAFGGAGPLHACELAETLRIPRVLVPPHPGVLSALGMILADVVKDYSRTVMLPALELDGAALERLFAPLFERARADLGVEGLAEDMMTLQPALDVRYAGQSFELTIPVRLDGAGSGGRGAPTPAEGASESAHAPGAGIIRDFHIAHRQRFSYASEGEPVEVVNVRLKAIGRTAKPRFSRLPPGDTDPWPARIGRKQVHFGGARHPGTTKPIQTSLYRRDRLAHGNVVNGPSVVFQLDTTTVIPPGWAATVDVWGNLIVEPERR